MRGVAGSALVLAVSVALFGAVGRTEHARAAEGDEIGAGQGRETPSPPPSPPPSQPVSTDTICGALAQAAAQNDLPVDFFTRLIWQESRFDPAAVSRAGAQGVAQFMPSTASWRGLSNPFDPLEAIAESARLLRDLRRDFGNLGLAAAAYNAGPARVRDWLAGRRALPGETRAYVRIVTGHPPEQWVGANASTTEMRSEKPVPCGEVAALVARTAPPASKPTPVWGVELVGGPTDETALAAYRRLEQKYASILSGRDTYIVHHGLGRGMMGWAHVHVAADDRPGAAKLCADLRSAGVSYCEVQRARSAR
jgi:Transglycosylase SLT domain